MENRNEFNRRVTLCEDGKYRWVYEMNLFLDPTVFFLVFKIFFFILLGMIAVTCLVDAIEWGAQFVRHLPGTLKIYGILFAVMTALTALGYLVYAAMMGGKYVVEFEMDDKGVLHRQTAAQAKKAKAVGAAAIGAGAATGRFAAMGAGMSAQRTELYSDFSRVKRVRALPLRRVIKVNAPFCRNQVYAPREDFDFVRDYIVSHCPNLRGRKDGAPRES